MEFTVIPYANHLDWLTVEKKCKKKKRNGFVKANVLELTYSSIIHIISALTWLCPLVCLSHTGYSLHDSLAYIVHIQNIWWVKGSTVFVLFHFIFSCLFFCFRYFLFIYFDMLHTWYIYKLYFNPFAMSLSIFPRMQHVRSKVSRQFCFLQYIFLHSVATWSEKTCWWNFPVDTILMHAKICIIYLQHLISYYYSQYITTWTVVCLFTSSRNRLIIWEPIGSRNTIN